MVRRQVHLCLPDFDATQFMPSLVDVLIPGCPLVWLDDTTGKADETVANLRRIFRLSKRPGSKANLSMVSSQEDGEGLYVEEGEKETPGKRQRTFIFSADYRPPTSVRTPARHKASLLQGELADHAFGPPAEGYDFHDRVSAPYYAKPFYEAVSNCSSSASSSAPMLSTPSLSGGSSSSSPSPDFPLSPASTSMSVTIASSRTANEAAISGHDTGLIGTEAESYFPPQPIPKSKDLSPVSSPSTLATTTSNPLLSSISHKSQSRSARYRTTHDPGSEASTPQRLDRSVDCLGKKRVTTANYEERRSTLPGPSTPLESQLLRALSPPGSSGKHRPDGLRHCASFPQAAQSNMQKQKRTAETTGTQATTVTLQVGSECDNPISISGHSHQNVTGTNTCTSSPPPSLRSRSSNRSDSSSTKAGMATTTLVYTSETGLTTSTRRYVPPPKGSFRSSYTRALRSEMASSGQTSLLQTIAELPAKGTFSLLPLVFLHAQTLLNCRVALSRLR